MSRTLTLLLVLAAGQALANHPGARLDEVMAGKEPAFEAADLRRMPDPEMRTAEGAPLSLSELEGQIVVLSFMPEGCGASCAEQQSVLASVQSSINITPMREMVTFLTVHPSGEPPGGGWDAANWRAVTPDGGATVAALTAEFAALSARDGGTPMVHVIDRGARHAGTFHGAAFGRVNMVLYINGLTNAPPPEPGLVERVLRVFR